MCKAEIPIWQKAILTVEEASAYAGGMNVAIIRLAANQAIKLGAPNFECYMTGNKICIVRTSFEVWLSELGRRHTIFNIQDCQEKLQQILRNIMESEKEEPKKGRPRKNRGREYAI